MFVCDQFTDLLRYHMQIMPRVVKFMHCMPMGQVIMFEQSSAQAVCIMPLTVIGTHFGTAVPPGDGSQSIAGVVQPVSAQKPSIGFIIASTD